MASNRNNDDNATRGGGNLRGSGDNRRSAQGDGSMSVREAGQKGGEIGGQRVRELVEEGKQAERGGERGNR